MPDLASGMQANGQKKEVGDEGWLDVPLGALVVAANILVQFCERMIRRSMEETTWSLLKNLCKIPLPLVAAL